MRRRNWEHPSNQRRLGKLQRVCGFVLGQAACRCAPNALASPACAGCGQACAKVGLACSISRQRGPLLCRCHSALTPVTPHRLCLWAVQPLPQNFLLDVGFAFLLISTEGTPLPLALFSFMFAWYAAPRVFNVGAWWDMLPSPPKPFSAQRRACHKSRHGSTSAVCARC